MLKPLSEYVVLSQVKQENKTESGIILSTTEKDKPSIAIVEAVGPDVKDVMIGNKVVYQTYSGTKVKLNDHEYLIIKQENILAIYE